MATLVLKTTSSRLSIPIFVSQNSPKSWDIPEESAFRWTGHSPAQSLMFCSRRLPIRILSGPFLSRARVAHGGTQHRGIELVHDANAMVGPIEHLNHLQHCWSWTPQPADVNPHGCVNPHDEGGLSSPSESLDFFAARWKASPYDTDKKPITLTSPDTSLVVSKQRDGTRSLGLLAEPKKNIRISHGEKIYAKENRLSYHPIMH